MAALKEAFDRDHARLELERAQLDEQRRRAEEAMRLELRRHAADREVGRLRLLAGTALVGWIAAVVVMVVRLESMSVLGMALNMGGRLAEAEATLQDGLSVAPDDTALLAVLGRTLVLQGRRAEAEAIRERFSAMSAAQYVSPTDRAKLALALELWDEAFEMAERSRVERRGWIVYMRVDALWDPVREDPRYRALLTKMGIPGPDGQA